MKKSTKSTTKYVTKDQVRGIVREELQAQVPSLAQMIAAELNKAQACPTPVPKTPKKESSVSKKGGTILSFNKKDKNQKDKQTEKPDPKNYAPKSLTNYDSYKAARNHYVWAVTGEPKKWIPSDEYTRIAKPWEKVWGTWVSGKGIVK